MWLIVFCSFNNGSYQGEGRGAPKESSGRGSDAASSSSSEADAGPSLNGLLFATLDGGFGSVVPIPERDFRRLERLQRQMASRALGHLAGCVLISVVSNFLLFIDPVDAYRSLDVSAGAIHATFENIAKVKEAKYVYMTVLCWMGGCCGSLRTLMQQRSRN